MFTPHSFTYQINQDGNSNFNRYVGQIVKAINRYRDQHGERELKTIFTSCFSGIETVIFTRVAENDPDYTYLLQLLQACTKTRSGSGVYKVTLKRNHQTYTGYTLKKGSIKSTYHGTARKLTRSVKPYLYVFDLTKLCAEAYATNTLQNHTKKNIYQEHVRKDVLTKIATKQTKTKKPRKVYETNRAIAPRMKEKMSNNAFLLDFDFVELANNVNLLEFSQWEKAFVALKKQLPFPDVSDHSLRFKKLGKQRAGGMYYVKFKCVVINVRDPGTFVHEIGHLIDFRQHFSKKKAFQPIHQLYTQEVTKRVDQLSRMDPFSKQWNGKGQYNKAYYLERVEVFARCFELYVHGLKIQNPLLANVENQPPYPQTPELQEMVHRYFSMLLSSTLTKKTG